MVNVDDFFACLGIRGNQLVSAACHFFVKRRHLSVLLGLAICRLSSKLNVTTFAAAQHQQHEKQLCRRSDDLSSNHETSMGKVECEQVSAMPCEFVSRATAQGRK